MTWNARVRSRAVVGCIPGAFLLSLVQGCGNETGTGGGTECDTQADCPIEEVCVDGVCVELDIVGGGDTDAGEDPGTDPGRDAPADSDAADAAGDPDGRDVSDTTDPIDATDTTDTSDTPDAPDAITDYGEPCSDDSECDSGYCIPGVEGGVCTIVCTVTEECGEGWECDALTTEVGVALCWPDVDELCGECGSDDDCGTVADTCVELPDGAFCARDCSERGCPSGWTCADATSIDGANGRQCVPEIGVCSGCFDEDEDGWGVGTECLGPDCDDTSDVVNTDAPEICDGLDNDCDGLADAISETCYSGAVGTLGVGLCSEGVRTCTDGDWGACEGESTPVDELCDNQDNDCDGTVDDFTEACYTGPAGTEFVGECEAGARACVLGEFGDCRGEVLPIAEVCDWLDNDCDGVTDGMTQSCYSGDPDTAGVGVCAAGTETCTDGLFGDCEGEVLPGAETCDGLDNDCDGNADGYASSCYTGPAGTEGVGLCAAGTETCAGGLSSGCVGETTPGTETCNAVDDNCDGNIDEGCSCTDGEIRSCYRGPAGTEGIGVCAAGTQACVDGVLDVCQGDVTPTAEQCDGLDNDCDGAIDGEVRDCYDGPAGTLGVGLCAQGAQTCVDGAFGSCSGQVLPEVEACDGLDNDCDGTADGINQTCYSGPAGTAGVGICTAGTQTCTGGTFSACAGEVTPGTEACDGLDNDCDGTADEGCGCLDGQSQSCYSGPAGTAGVGVCAAGLQTCSGGAWGACSGETLPGVEICDDVDNDCDGTTDGFSQSCYTGPAGTQGVGVCASGTQTCTSGSYGSCNGQITPAAETCDGLDNDCDGSADGQSESCYTGPAGTQGVGICVGGTRACGGGTWGACGGEVLPATEACDTIDNDCDGTVDEGCSCVNGTSQSCYTGPAGTQGVGICAGGTQTCTGGSWGICNGEVTPGSESCNGVDDDCSGTADGMSRSCYSGPAGTQGVGACRAGSETCTSGAYGACTGEITPGTESCNNIDDDCDGSTDGFSESCYSGPAGTQGVGICRAGNRTCASGTYGACGGEIVPATEICDTFDNDCDGQTDEGCNCVNGTTQACYTGPAGTEGVGICASGSQTCVSGDWGACTGQTLPGTESCNNIDDDCNGTTDNLNRACYSGPAGTAGIGACAAGTETCTAGTWGSCVGEVTPGTETCNSIDDDCNGSTDGFSEACYTGPAGTQGVGLCVGGNRTCTSGSYSACVGEVTPAGEACDTFDNDCDGGTDEGCNCVNGTTQSCYTGPGGTQGVGICLPGSQNCVSGDWGACGGQTLPGTESCNNLDDDCNGTVDGMTRSCYSGPAGTQGVGICLAGTETCTSGAYGACTGQVTPGTESCNNLDDDCNGTVDGMTRSCYTGPVGTENVGICRGGTETCTSGAYGSCSGQVTPGSETCGNGLDDDCDSSVDEGCCQPISIASAVTTTSTCLTAGTGARAAVVVTLVDASGAPVIGASMTMTTTAGTISSVSSSGNTYWATLTAPATVTDAQVTVQVTDPCGSTTRTLTTRPTVTVRAGFPNTETVGGATGCPVDGNVRVRVLNGETGAPLSGAFVMLGAAAAADIYEDPYRATPAGDNTATTDANGYATFTDFGTQLEDPILVTVGAASRQYVSLFGVDSSDFVVPTRLVVPTTQMGRYTGRITNIAGAPGFLTNAALGIALGDVDIEQLANFSLDTLLADDVCYDTTVTEPMGIPANIYIPSQYFGAVPQKTYTSAPLTYGSHVLAAIGGYVPISALTGGGGIATAIQQLVLTNIGTSGNLTVSAPGPTNLDINASTALTRDVDFSVSGPPANSDVFVIVAGDWDSSASASLGPGEGRLFVQGFKFADSAGATFPLSITQTPRVQRSGSFSSIEYVGATIALYLDEAKPGIPAGTADGASAIMNRAGTLTPGAGAEYTFSNYFPIRPLTRTGRSYAAAPMSGAGLPRVDFSRTVISQRVTQTYTACTADDSERNITYDLWVVYSPSTTDSFALPALPAGWPRATLAGDIQGLIDTTATAEDDAIRWSQITASLGLASGWSYNNMRFNDLRRYVTQVTQNDADF